MTDDPGRTWGRATEQDALLKFAFHEAVRALEAAGYRMLATSTYGHVISPSEVSWWRDEDAQGFDIDLNATTVTPHV